MNIDEFTKQNSKFLKAEEVAQFPNEVFSITGEGMILTSEKFKNERLHIPGVWKGEERVFDCSKTNARVIKDAVGADTSQWLGVLLHFETYKTKTSDGKLVTAINVKKVQSNKPAPATA
jgi:hypothetical protein